MHTSEELRSGRCKKHGRAYWIESTPIGQAGYCHQCAKDNWRGEQLGDTTGASHNSVGYYDAVNFDDY